MFDWNDLRAFLSVARGGSTLAASRALGVNQTTVARRVEALEQALGLKLFERGQTGSRLTEAGRDLVGEAEKVEAAAQGFASRASAHVRGMAGSIRLTANELIAQLMVTPALAEFRKLYPDVQLELIISDRLLDIEGGEADVAIRGALALNDSTLLARKVADFHFALYCSRDYAERRGAPTLETLATHDLVGGGAELAGLPGVQWMFAQAPGAKPAALYNTMSNLAQAVRSGLGVGPIACLVGDADPDLMRCSPQIPGISGAAWIVTRRELKDTPRVRAFIDFIVPYITATVRALEAKGQALREGADGPAAAGPGEVSSPV
ncbi:LysR family transcriptional regulator [Phenylobacterium sp.]|uniref:LysR family transcriptional regulator n=1 Tax=Phenylobacterium sp. TaxID=1871053 RepID=UPI0035B08026